MMIRTLAYLLLLAIVVFAVGSYSFQATHVFHVLNAVAISAGITTIAAYVPAIYDAWRRRSNIIPGHLLALGIVTSWSGLIVRLSRWFFTETEPANGLDQWEYNIGLSATILSAAFLINAVAFTPPRWSYMRVLFYTVTFLILVISLWSFDYWWVGLPHFGPIGLKLK